MTPAFLYFDLGNVLLNFDHRRGARQMAEVACVDVDLVWEQVFESDLLKRFEAGEIDRRQFYNAFCEVTQSRPDPEALEYAGSTIFECNATILPLVVHLEAAGFRLGILSNTNESHWNYCRRRFGTIGTAFQVSLLSFQVQFLKPDPQIYRVAAERAGVSPQEVFFVDDLAENVAAAREVGFDAIQYTTTLDLAKALRARNVRSNF